MSKNIMVASNTHEYAIICGPLLADTLITICETIQDKKTGPQFEGTTVTGLCWSDYLIV